MTTPRLVCLSPRWLGSRETMEVARGFAASVRGFGQLRDLRDRLTTWMSASGVDEVTQADLALAVHEVATNGIEASPSDEVAIEADRPTEVVRVVVTNEGEPFGGVPGPKDPTSARGRGLDIAAALTDSVTFDPSERGTAVTLTKRVR